MLVVGIIHLYKYFYFYQLITFINYVYKLYTHIINYNIDILFKLIIDLSRLINKTILRIQFILVFL